jgi:hypothetical protein
LPGRERLLLVRRRATSGRIVGVWSWRDAVASVERTGDTLVVNLRAGDRHVHRRTDLGWRIETADRLGSRRSVDLAGHRAPSVGPPSILLDQLPPEVAEAVPSVVHPLPYSVQLGEAHYRRSEVNWADAGAPGAEVAVRRNGSVLVLDVRVASSERLFVVPGTENPYDNERASINGDGIQLYLETPATSGGWLLVPLAGRDQVEVLPVEGWEGTLEPVVRWHAIEDGYAIHLEVDLGVVDATVGLDVIVNETASGRVRRRGQLVMSGAAGEFVYLRGDRHDRARLLHFSLADA